MKLENPSHTQQRACVAGRNCHGRESHLCNSSVCNQVAHAVSQRKYGQTHDSVTDIQDGAQSLQQPNHLICQQKYPVESNHEPGEGQHPVPMWLLFRVGVQDDQYGEYATDCEANCNVHGCNKFVHL